jgi:hypothetical protein
LSLDQRVGLIEPLLQHEEDAQDHNLPLLIWYAVEPLVGADVKRGAMLMAKSKFPQVRTFISRRMASAQK